MSELLKKIKERLNKKSTSVEEIQKIAKELGEEIGENRAICILYELDYRSSRLPGAWLHEEGVRINRITSALNKLKKSKICDKEQCFLLEVANNRHLQKNAIQSGIAARGLTVHTSSISMFCAKYGVFQNQDGVYQLPELPTELLELVAKYKKRKYFPLSQALQKHLKGESAELSKVIEFAKKLGFPMTKFLATKILYAIDYSYDHALLRWVLDPDAKMKRVSEAIKKLQNSKVCDREQCFLLEIFNQRHQTITSIQKALVKKGLDYRVEAIRFHIKKFGITVNDQGFFQLPELSTDLQEIAKNNQNKPYCTLEEALREAINFQPISLDGAMEMAEAWGREVERQEMRRLFYTIDYTPDTNSDKWFHDPAAKIKRISNVLKKLIGSKICNENQGFILEIIHHKHYNYDSLKNALQEKGFQVASAFIKYNTAKYGVFKNADGYYQFPELPSDLLEVASENKGRTYFTIQKGLREHLNGEKTTLAKARKILEKISNQKIDDSQVILPLYEIDYTQGKKPGSWIFDPHAKIEKIKHALEKLVNSPVCDDEQLFLLELINNNSHETLTSIKNSLVAKGLKNITLGFVTYNIAKYGVFKNDTGYFQHPEIPINLLEIAKNNRSKSYLTIKQAVINQLNKQPTTANKVCEIAKDLNSHMSTNFASQILYEANYKQGKAKSVWVHDERAKLDRVEIALKNLEISKICNEYQCFLMEVITKQYSRLDSIDEALKKKISDIGDGFAKYNAKKFGLVKNQSGYYVIEGLTEELREIAEKNKDRRYYPKEKFVTDYAKKHNGKSTVNKIYNVLKQEGFEEYHNVDKNLLQILLLNNEFVLEGDDKMPRRLVLHRPGYRFELIEQAYFSFTQGSEYYSIHALILYYISHQNIKKLALIKLLKEKHGILGAYTNIAMSELQLVNKKNGLGFPKGSSQAGRISQSMFMEVTKNKKPISIADKMYDWFEQGMPIGQIQSQLTEALTEKEIEKYLKEKQKHSSKKNSSALSSGSNEGTQNFLDETIGDQINVKEPYTIKRPAITPEERLNRYNHEQIKKLQKARKAKFQEMLEIGRQLTPAKQTFIYKPHEQKLLEDVFCEISNQGQYSLSYQISPIQLPEMRNMFQMARAEGRVVQLFSSQEYMYGRTGTDGFTNYRTGSGYSNGNGNSPSLGRGALRTGPGYAVPLTPMASRVAGGYIGVFIVLPHMYTNTKTIISSETNKLEKSSAALNIGVMIGQMWLFTKFIASKYPKTAAVIMVGTAGQHAYKWYDDIGIGRTKSEIYFLNEEEMLKVGMPCIDGRKPVFLNPKAAKHSLIKVVSK